MKRKIINCLALAVSFVAAAQEPDYTEVVGIIDEAEDTTQVTSIADIIATQEIITSRNTNVAHFNNVWRRKSYFNLSYNKHVSLDGKDIELGYMGYNNGVAPKFEGDWGASIMLGHSYNLHKKPIANVVQFNLDYTYIDLNINHYKAEDADKLYNSANSWQYEHDKEKSECLYTPWCLQKYEMNFGMSIGPSITVAPFTYVNVPQLHFFKINVYYHIGYHVSMLWMINDEDKDANPTTTYPSYDQNDLLPAYQNYNKMNESLKMEFGHGLISSFGFSVSWKSIGIGYEVRKAKLNYKSLNQVIFGGEQNKFNAATSRVYLTIRY